MPGMAWSTHARYGMEYACQVWHGGLTGGQSDFLESDQIRAMRIIMPDASYELSLEI